MLSRHKQRTPAMNFILRKRKTTRRMLDTSLKPFGVRTRQRLQKLIANVVEAFSASHRSAA